MRYGNVDLKLRDGSLSITRKKSQIIRHYPGTDKSDAFVLGREPTTITSEVFALNDEERILLEQLFSSDVERYLNLGSFFYKRVITGDSSEPKPVRDDLVKWVIPVEFIALDPIPYSTTTGEALY
jgi:hypothetical protein